MRHHYLIYLCILVISCQTKTTSEVTEQEEFIDSVAEDNGKRDYDLSFPQVLRKDSIQDFAVSVEMSAFQEALESQRKIVRAARNNATKTIGNLKIGFKELKETYSILSSLNEINDSTLMHNFNYYQLQGEDSIGNVHFTGYFTPELDVRSKPDSVFKYPFYRIPKRWKGQLPSREQIDTKKVLAGKNLEIAWCKSRFDNFILHVQGSGLVRFEDGTKKILAYGGKNNLDYKSIGRYFVNNGIISEEDISVSSIKAWFDEHPEKEEEILNINESYIFFRLVDPIPKGAAGVSLVPKYSSAIDTNFIPFGSALLAEVPQLDSLGNFIQHEYQILFAMDRGGAIKGPGRVDIYCGFGDEGFKTANFMNHYGRVWLLMPK
ncbi:MAG: murein transglycosylase A [bacterium]|nr:murein transglycosylase A [bacterium]